MTKKEEFGMIADNIIPKPNDRDREYVWAWIEEQLKQAKVDENEKWIKHFHFTAIKIDFEDRNKGLNK